MKLYVNNSKQTKNNIIQQTAKKILEEHLSAFKELAK